MEETWVIPMIGIIIVILVYLILKARIIHLPCFGCSEGSWWYRCFPGTGKGSAGCLAYQTTTEVIGKIEQTAKQIDDIILQIKSKIGQPIDQALTDLRKIKQKIPKKIPKVNIPRVRLPNINCGIKIPVINKSINPCSSITSELSGTVNQIIEALNKGIDDLTNAINQLMHLMQTGVVDIADQVEMVFKAFKPLQLVQQELGMLSQHISQLEQAVEKAGIGSLIKNGLLKSISAVIPIRQLTVLAVLAGLVYLLPLIGNLYGSYQALNALTAGYFPLILAGLMVAVGVLLVGAMLT